MIFCCFPLSQVEGGCLVPVDPELVVMSDLQVRGVRRILMRGTLKPPSHRIINSNYRSS